MAENLESNQALDRPLEPTADPIADKSLSAPILIVTLLLMATLAWALYDELFGLRPWKSMQREFTDRYVSFLQKKVLPNAKTNIKDIKDSADYQDLNSKYEAAVSAAAGDNKSINDRLDIVNNQLAAIQDPYQDDRAQISAIRYKQDQTDSQSAKDSYKSEIDSIAAEKKTVSNYPSDDGKSKSNLSLNFAELQQKFTELTEKKNKLLADQAALLKPQKDLLEKRDKYVTDHQAGLTGDQVTGLINKYQNFDFKIQQINVPEANIVDRCESCHVGIREPIRITQQDMKGDNQGAFTSHPNPSLLQKHDPDRFGCTACHGGNGRATTSVEKGHGNYEHWLWPMYNKENVESGCNQCHNKDVVLAGAEVLNRGKELFMERGCVGCHKYEGFDRETDGLQKATQQIKQLETDKQNTLHQADLAVDRANNTSDDAEAKRLFAEASNLRQSVSQIDSKIQQFEISTKYLLRDQKKVGPNLKEVRVKLKKEFIPEWLRDPQAFRPGTKMPTFRLSEEERKDVAAFIWQSGWEGITLQSQPQGDGAHGKELLETRGCLACHSIGEGANRVGGDFSANLSRVGDKNNYDYVVRWVHNPRERSLPYSPTLKRDLTKEDYDKAGKPFIVDEQHSTSPVDGHQLQIQSMTVMPVFRLSDQDARDIATYLTSLKTGVQFPDASFMDEPGRKVKGEALVKQYGCAGCHEIKGLEDQQRIGTELTVEGSKPIERFDFALFTHKAEEGILPDGRESMRNGKKASWYDAKGFFEQKLANPAIYDVGKNKGPDERLRMPNIYFKDKSEIDAVTTFLLGSVDSAVPANLKYNPGDQRQFIQDGWWLVKKYNCMGCHNLQVGQRTILMDLPQYQGGEQEKLPPRLVTEGARVNPDWLLRFLKNPSLSDTDTNRNGVRQYLGVRMPTFDFSPNELQTLVRFFNAGSSQPMPYIAEQQQALEPAERDMARALFTSQAAPCLKCHMTGDPAHDKVATAPNFLLARERLKPQWTERWILNPRLIDPTTAMPSGLFKHDDQYNRNVFSGPVPDSFKDYKKDHADLLVRYMFQITTDEQAKLGVKGPAPSGGADKTKSTGRNNVPTKKPSVERVALARRPDVVSSP